MHVHTKVPRQSVKKTRDDILPHDGSTIARRIVCFMQAVSQSHNVSKHARSKMTPKFESMVDVGCGDGHSSALFAPYFNKVTGIDKSKAQVLKAEEYSKTLDPKSYSCLQFQVASGENMPFRDSSQDLVCFSRSFHWMELMSDAMREARRVLKPDGCLAMYCTGFPKISKQLSPDEHASNVTVEKNKKANELLDNFFRHDCEIHPRSVLAVDDKYQRIYEAITVDHEPRKGSKFIIIDDKNLAIRKNFVTIREFAQMLQSYAGYRCAKITLSENNSQNDPLNDFVNNLKSTWSVDKLPNDEIYLDITWDVSLILSTRPAKLK
uniref:probable S-adenosylmethionine-dependent methyltransferase CRG1 n=1 Tax=Styela clava TaxID=7725 RepID=UPI001939FABD|nr:probable S-adenosylmethionine-dependent methyltransferase CRG1 [Styela clava]